MKSGAVVETKGYSSTLSISTLNHLLVTNYLRRGDGIIATPPGRRKERLFGVNGTGRSSLKRCYSKLGELVEGAYVPSLDTCVKAFVRLLALMSTVEESSEASGGV